MVKMFVTSFAAAASCALVAQAKPTLLYHTTFDSAEAITSPAVGPAGTVSESATFQAGRVGNALYVPVGDNPVATVPIQQGLIKSKGRIEFYAKLEGSSTSFATESPVVFFRMPTSTDGRYFDITINPNNGAGCSGVCGFFGPNDCSTWSEYYTHTSLAEIFQDPIEGWHHFEIVWNHDGVGVQSRASEEARAVGYVDGVLKSTPVSGYGGGFSEITNFAFNLYFPSRSGLPHVCGNNRAFLIDDFKIWDSDKRPNQNDLTK